MKKIIMSFLILNCLLSFGQESAVSNKKSKISLNVNYGLLYHIGGTRGFYSFGETIRFKFDNPYDFNLNYAHKGKKRWHEFGIAYFQKEGVTNSNSGYVSCNSGIFFTNVSYKAKFNYLAFHYGIEFPFKNELFSITPFFRIGHSFNSTFEKIIDPGVGCPEIYYSDLQNHEKTPLLETGFGLNYKLVRKNHFDMALRFRSSLRGFEPQTDIYFSLGLVMEFGN